MSGDIRDDRSDCFIDVIHHTTYKLVGNLFLRKKSISQYFGCFLMDGSGIFIFIFIYKTIT